MAQSNHERVGKPLELLNQGLRPFVERELRAVYGEGWLEAVGQELRDDRPRTRRRNDLTSWDTQALLTIIWDHWNDVFRNTLGPAEHSRGSELREVRNKWAHQEAFSYLQAEFAADLGQVRHREGSDEDRDPTEFFRRTFLTEGLTHLLHSALTHLSGQNATPVVELQTNFGGEKTRSMLALYSRRQARDAFSAQLRSIPRGSDVTLVGSLKKSFSTWPASWDRTSRSPSKSTWNSPMALPTMSSARSLRTVAPYGLRPIGLRRDSTGSHLSASRLPSRAPSRN